MVCSFLSLQCSKHGKTPLEAELRRQRNALKAIDQFVRSIQKCLRCTPAPATAILGVCSTTITFAAVSHIVIHAHNSPEGHRQACANKPRVMFCTDWDRSGKSLRSGITGYFYDKPAYQRPVEEITSALVSSNDVNITLAGEC